MSLGFESSRDYYIYKKLGSLEEYKKLKECGFNDVDEYLKAKETGFIGSFEKLKELGYINNEDSKNYLSYYEYGFEDNIEVNNDYDIYTFAKNRGFPNFQTFLDALNRGFSLYSEYNKAISLGYKDANDFYSAIALGFKYAKDYYLARELGIYTYKEFLEFKEFNTYCKLFRVDTLEEGYLLKILLELEENATISIEKIYNMLLEKREITNLKNRVNVHVFSGRKNKWYTTKFNSIDDLRSYLMESSIINIFGKYIPSKDVFVKKYDYTIKNTYLLLSFYYPRNISLNCINELLKSIKNIGFKYIGVIENRNIINKDDVYGYAILDTLEEIKKYTKKLLFGCNCIVITNIEFDIFHKNLVTINIDKNKDLYNFISKYIYENFVIERLKSIKSVDLDNNTI